MAGQPAHAQSAAQPQHQSSGGGQGVAVAGGPELGRPRVSKDGGNGGGSKSARSLQNTQPGPAHTTAPGEQGPTAAPGTRPPRSRRSGRRRNSSSNGAVPNGSDSDSAEDESDEDEGAAAAPNFGGVAKKAQQICSDALRRLQQTARWSPEGSAALEHAFAGIVQVSSLLTSTPASARCDHRCTFSVQRPAAWR